MSKSVYGPFASADDRERVCVLGSIITCGVERDLGAFLNTGLA